ncbi:class I SAM-dependent methyltransferase [Mariniluteicoccus flavus]
MSEKSRDFWDSMAGEYDRRSARLERRFLNQGRVWACSRATGDVLDVGVGTGANLPHLPAGVRITGLDQSPAMVEQATRRARELGLDATMRVGDAGVLPFPDASFDTVLSTFVLCCVPDEGAALREMVRVLRPGGRLVLADHVESTNGAVRVGQRVLEAITGPGQGERFTRRPAGIVAEMGELSVVEGERRAFGVLEQVCGVRN